MIPRVRESAGGLYLCAVLVILGFITNRLNVTITGMEASAGVHYFPKWSEIAVTGSIVGIGFAVFGLAVKYLPIFPAAGERSATPLSAASRAAPELSHARP
jgi:Ni/Fe-hydrogenase subunit HybB-like protein